MLETAAERGFESGLGVCEKRGASLLIMFFVMKLEVLLDCWYEQWFNARSIDMVMMEGGLD